LREAVCWFGVGIVVVVAGGPEPGSSDEKLQNLMIGMHCSGRGIQFGTDSCISGFDTPSTFWYAFSGLIK
jgi:hypothetical protein